MLRGDGMSAVVTETIQVGAVSNGEPGKVGVRLVYNPHDPYAVHACLTYDAQDPVWWAFARSLLAEGMQRAAGTGDVRIWPSAHRPMRRPMVLHALMSSPEGRLEMYLPWLWVRDFLFRTFDAVSPGLEFNHLDVDRAIALIREDA
jgi:hypothetical protein